jgi:HD-GYP domain-containing protein (c-di-GMP phosphodiesterase class II)
MSSDRPSGAPSHQPEPQLGLAALLRIRGLPLLEALERHVPGAREHAEATASYAFAIAAELGFDRERCGVARETAQLHEVGQVYVPVPVLQKPAVERSSEERELFESQYEAAYRLARGAGIPENACGWLLRLRERFDGSGPEGLAGEEIPIESRMTRTACVGQTALAAPGIDDPHRNALSELTGQAGAELDPRTVAALAAVLDRAVGSADLT